jgi:putative nucleotidyltransferase-like protein
MTVAAAAIAAFGLPSRLTVDEAALGDEEFDELLWSCEQHRLLGQLGAAIRAGAVRLTDEQERTFEETFRAWLTHCLRIERLVLDATAALDRAGIDSRVLKGVALAHTAYDDPSERVFGDVDLLVPASELTRASRVLTRAFDAERPQPELRPGFDDRFGKEVMLKVGGLELDLHRTFVEGAYGLTVRFDDLFAPPYRFPLGIVELEALPMPQRLLHASYAAAFGDWPPRLMSLRDLAQLVHREKPNLVDVLLMAREWQCEPIVARAVTLAWDELGLTAEPPVVQWARRFVPSTRQRRMLEWHEGPARAFTGQLAALLVLPGTEARLAYLRAIMFPQREYLAARGFNAAGHFRRAWHRILK